ncbi:MAG: hypothetical protein IKM42_04915 [Clostridia bacterium]|nr:hypothetical protein [Clostridia bacterium]MBR7112250.1 hypothetical protein [Clostridia bacterium]
MKIIALCEKDKSGKTETLKRLIALLEQQEGVDCITHSPKNYDERKEFSNDSDIWALFCYRGVHIFVTTMGDSIPEIQKDVKDYLNICDIFVCACHKSFVTTLTNWAAPDICEILEKQVKLSLKEREDVNQKDAEDLLAKIALAILKVA